MQTTVYMRTWEDPRAGTGIDSHVIYWLLCICELMQMCAANFCYECLEAQLARWCGIAHQCAITSTWSGDD